MKIHQLEQGDLVDIVEDTDKSEMLCARSIIKGINYNGRIALFAPVKDGVVIQLKKQVSYRLHRKYENGVFIVPFDVLSYITRAGEDFHIIQCHGEGRSIQQRGLFRLKCDIPVEFTLQSGEISGFSSGGTILDLSGGGLKLESSLQIAKGTSVSLGIPLRDLMLNAEGQVIDSIEAPLQPGVYHCGLKFTKLDDADQETIIRHLHREQLKNLKSKRRR